MRRRDTVGGVFEVLAYGAPPGLGSHVHYDRKLDARLALALMSIQSVKGVEVGDFVCDGVTPWLQGARRDRCARGSHRPPDRARAGHRGRHEHRRADQAPSRDEAVLDRAEAPRHRGSLDGEPAVAIKQRTDVCAVPAGGVVGESVVSFELADAMLEKLGATASPETRGNLERYLEGLG